MFVENNWRQQFWDCFQSGTAREFRHLMFFYLILLALGVLSGVYDKYIRWLLSRTALGSPFGASCLI